MQRHSVIEGLFGEARFDRDRRCLKNFRRIWSNHVESNHFPRFGIANHLVQSALITSGKDIFHRSEIGRIDLRSEEHTSELQSLMRISYAVFCLKKNNKQLNTN